MGSLRNLERDRLEKVVEILAKRYKKRVLDKEDERTYSFVFLEMLDPFFPDSHIIKKLRRVYILDLEDEDIWPAYVKGNIVIAPAKIMEAERMIRVHDNLYLVEYTKRLRGYFQHPTKPKDPKKLKKYEILYGFFDTSDGIFLIGPFCFDGILIHIASEYGYNYDNWKVRMKKGKKWVNLGTVEVSTVEDMLEVVFYCNKLRELMDRRSG